MRLARQCRLHLIGHNVKAWHISFREFHNIQGNDDNDENNDNGDETNNRKEQHSRSSATISRGAFLCWKKHLGTDQ